MAIATVTKHPKNINTSPNQVNVYKYPNDLTANPALSNYVGFYINVPDGTTTNRTNETAIGYIPVDGSTNVHSANAHTGLINAAATVVGAAAGASASIALLKKGVSMGAGGGYKGKLAVVAAATTVGAVVGDIAASAAFQNNQYQRITGCIMLGLHDVPTYTSSAKWEDTALGTAGGLLAGGSSADGSSLPMGDMAIMAARNAIKLPGGSKALAGKLNVADELSGGINSGAVTSSITKEVPNPFREQLFSQMSFREFSYTYHFMPKSKEEAETVRNIIDTFRFHMHPDLSQSGIFFKFPSQFEIVYYFEGEENPNMGKIATCVLMNCDVSYGGMGVRFATFDDGMPVETIMTLHFRETEILTKARIKDGY